MSLLKWKSAYLSLVGSDRDWGRQPWRAEIPEKYKKDRRVEIRTTIRGRRYPADPNGDFANVLLAVRPDGSVRISLNSRAVFTAEEWDNLLQAVEEARQHLRSHGENLPTM